MFSLPLPGGGHFDVATYGVMLALGTLAGVFMTMRLVKREGISGETVIDLGFWAVIAGVLGAKAWYIVQNWGAYEDKMELIRNFRSGLVFYGGVVGAIIVIAWFARRRHFGVLKMLDAAAPAGMLGLAFGRIGCFFNGCCYGRITDAWWGVRFPKILDGNNVVGSPAFAAQLNQELVKLGDKFSKPVVPTQLMECAGALAVLGIVLVARRSRRFYGEQVALVLALYAIVRFTVEHFRGDNAAWLGALTIPQVFSVAMFALGVAGFAALRLVRPAAAAVGAEDAARAPQTKQGKRIDRKA